MTTAVVVQYDTNLCLRMVGTTPCNIHAAAEPITWNPHHWSVECSSWFHLLSATGEEYKRQAIRSRRVCPPLCFGQYRLRTLPHYKRENMYRYKGPTRPLKDRHFSKRPDSKNCLSVLVNYISMFGVLFFSRPKNEPFSVFSLIVSCYSSEASF